MAASATVPTRADRPQSDARAASEPGGPPPSNTGVGLDRCSTDGLYGWDWSSTTHDARDGIVSDLAAALGTSLAVPEGGMQGWARSLHCFDSGGYLLGKIFYGGGRDDVHVLSTSAAADSARRAVVGMDRARTARVDTRVDTLAPFDALVDVLRDAAHSYGSQIDRWERERRGESKGRTVYLGSAKSAVRVRLYEKWLESPGEYVEGTNRVEVQLRPPSKVKQQVSAWSRAETFCASRTTRELAVNLGDDLAPKASLHVRRGTPELERSLAAMGEQYGPGVRRWLERSGGDLGTILDYLGVSA